MNTKHFLNTIAGNVMNTQTSPILPTKYYLGLSSTAPAVDGTNVTEPAGGGYARIQLTGLSAPTDGVVKNTTSLQFPESTSTWGTVTHYAIYDAATEGNLLMFGTLNKARTVDSEVAMIIKPNTLTLSITN